MGDRKSITRKRSSPEPPPDSVSADAPRSYYASPPVPPPAYPHMYPPQHYSYGHGNSGSPHHGAPPPGYHHYPPHGGAPSMSYGGANIPGAEGRPGSFQQVTPDSRGFFPSPSSYTSPPSSVRRRTFTSTGTLSPSTKRPRRRTGEC